MYLINYEATSILSHSPLSFMRRWKFVDNGTGEF